MPPKSSVKRQQSHLEKDEEVRYALQAVVVCDYHIESFEPLATDLHPILFPLAGTPILGYTLESLERGGVEDVFLIGSHNFTQIESYVASSRWGEPNYPVKVRTIAAARAQSVGDALREIDRLGVVKSDFVLVRGGLLSNLPIPSLVEEHRRKKEVDKDAMLMTMVLFETDSRSALSRRRNLRTARLHVLAEDNAIYSNHYDLHRCLVSEHLTLCPGVQKRIQLLKEITDSHADIVLRNDLVDCNIEVCSPEVPALFTENFDYEDLRQDFVNGVLTSDLLQKNIYCYIAKSGYGANITSFEEYWDVSCDILNGVTAPFDPSMNVENTQNFIKKGSVWLDKDVKIEKTALVKNAVIGSGSLIGDGASVSDSIIGRNCVVPAGVQIRESILWNDVVLHKGVQMNRAIIASNSLIPEDTWLGCAVLRTKTKLAASTKFPASTSLIVYESDGQPYINEDSSDEEKLIAAKSNLTDSEISEIGSDTGSGSDIASRRSSMSGPSDIITNEEFYTEAEESLARAFQEKHSIEDAAIELKTLRMATNVTFHEVREAIVIALMNVAMTSPGDVGPTFAKWGKLLLRFMEDEDSQMDILLTAQRLFARKLREGVVERRAFVVGLQALYQADVLEEDKIVEWFNDDTSKGVGEAWGEDMANLRKAAEKFVTWLREAEEESDD